MSGRKKVFFLIPVILLIPIIVGMAPLNLAHKLANGGSCTQGKQVCINNHCPFHSLSSHDSPVFVNLNFALLDQELTPILNIHVLDSDLSHSDKSCDSVPLRC
jgi:hypothetical protein